MKNYELLKITHTNKSYIDKVLDCNHDWSIRNHSNEEISISMFLRDVSPEYVNPIYLTVKDSEVVAISPGGYKKLAVSEAIEVLDAILTEKISSIIE